MLPILCVFMSLSPYASMVAADNAYPYPTYPWGFMKSFAEVLPIFSLHVAEADRGVVIMRLQMRWAGHLASGWHRAMQWRTDSHADKAAGFRGSWSWEGCSYKETESQSDLWECKTCRNHIHRGWKWANKGQRLPACSRGDAVLKSKCVVHVVRLVSR